MGICSAIKHLINAVKVKYYRAQVVTDVEDSSTQKWFTTEYGPHHNLRSSSGSKTMETTKYAVLILLIMQTSMMVLTLRYTRTVDTSGHRCLSSTVVFLAEVVKSLTCIIIIFVQSKRNTKKFMAVMYDGLLGEPKDTIKMVVPAAVYAVQNNLLFIALSYLDAGTYQVTYQLKILTTAIFSVVILKKKLSIQQWISLFLLTVGVALVQFPSSEANSPSDDSNSVNSRLFGLVVLLLSCASSGFAGVYFELLLKSSSMSLWMRNVQMGEEILVVFLLASSLVTIIFSISWLYINDKCYIFFLAALFSMIFSAATLYFNDVNKIAEHGFFQGYNKAVIIVLLLQAYGGLLVACVVKYADNIVKGFATSLSIIVSSAISHFIFKDLQLSSTFITGTCIVLSSTYVYGRKSSSKKAP